MQKPKKTVAYPGALVLVQGNNAVKSQLRLENQNNTGTVKTLKYFETRLLSRWRGMKIIQQVLSLS
jgi:hypothetical protein